MKYTDDVAKHPAKKVSRFFFTDHSHRDFEYQLYDLLHDIRFLLLLILLGVLLK